MKVVILLGSGLSLSGVYLSSYTRDLPAFLAYYCIMNGLGSGCCYFIPLVCGWEYFPKKKGLVSGVILAGYGFSSFIFSLVSTKLVNPHGDSAEIEDPNTGVTYFGKDVADRVPFMLRTLVYIWICLVFIAFILISRPDKEDIVEPSEEESEDEDINASPVMSESGKRFEMSGNDIKTSNDGGS